MKYLSFFLLVFVSVNSFAQEKEVVLVGDSLIVRSESIASDPFKFGRDPLAYLKKKIKASKAKTEKSPVENRHVENQVDTTYEIKLGKDQFGIFKGKDVSFLLNAKIESNKFVTKHGIKVGMTKSEIKGVLKNRSITTIPKYMILENTEYPEYLILEFKKEKLKRIEFQGYVD